MGGKHRNGNAKNEARRVVLAKAEAAGWRCHWCGELLIRELTTVDHVRPLAQGGDNSPANLVQSCYPCNSARNNGIEQFAARIEHVLFTGLMARKLQRIAVEHDQLVIWLADLGYALPAEMRSHLAWVAAQSELPGWPKTRRPASLATALVDGDPGRRVALTTLERLHGRTLP